MGIGIPELLQIPISSPKFPRLSPTLPPMQKNWPFSFAFYFLFFASASALIPYLALYYQHIGLSGAQTGVLTAVGPLISMVGAPLLTGFADSRHRHKFVLSLSLMGVIITILAIPMTEQFALLFLVVAIYSFLGAPLISLSDSATMSMLGDRRALYGRIRTGGTFGWGLIAPLAGMVIEDNGLRWAFWLYAAGMFAALLVSQGLTFGPAVEQTQSFRKGIKNLLSNRRWLLFLGMIFVSGMAMAMVTTYLFPFMEEVGATRGQMGFSQSIATAAELPFLFFVNRLLDRFRARGVMLFSVFIVGVRLLLYTIFPTPTGILFIQLLHGVTFATIWVAGVSYTYEIAPAGLAATAQGVFSSMLLGFGSAAGNFFGALLFEALGGQQMYLWMGVVVLISLGVYLLLERRMDKPMSSPAAPNATVPS
ncbi:MAG: MFS transporter [Anaerolineales bacterium]|nr:MFS transporter [Anaerolineales bacterium]